MPRSRATCATGCPDSRTHRTASSLNASGYDRRVVVLILSSDFLILPLRKVSVKSGKVRISSGCDIGKEGPLRGCHGVPKGTIRVGV